MSSKQANRSSKQNKRGNQPNTARQAQQGQAQATAQARPQQNAAQAQSAQSAQLSQEAKRQARMERQAVAQAAAARRRRSKMMRNAAIWVGALVLVGGAILASVIGEASKPGASFAALASSPHVADANNMPIPYNSDPPTSGPHVGGLPSWSVHTTPITDALQVHALEDGGVIIHYKPDLDKAVVDRLASLAGVYHQNLVPRNHLVMAPDPELSSPIILTAWRRMQKFDTFDEAGIRKFIDAYIGIDRHTETAQGPKLP